MGEAHHFRHALRVIDVLAGATGFFFLDCRPVIIELQGHAYNVITFFGQHGRTDRTVHTSRHGHNDAGVADGFGKA